MSAEQALRQVAVFAVVLLPFGPAGPMQAAETERVSVHPDLHYINTSFDNASPLWWETDAEGAIQINLVTTRSAPRPSGPTGIGCSSCRRRQARISPSC